MFHLTLLLCDSCESFEFEFRAQGSGLGLGLVSLACEKLRQVHLSFANGQIVIQYEFYHYTSSNYEPGGLKSKSTQYSSSKV
jgi:hypothetical protein